MKPQTERIARESFWGALLSYLGVGLGFATTFFILTQYLTPEEVGLTRLLVELATLASSFALLGLSTSMSRYFPHFRSEDKAHLHHGFWVYALLIAMLGLGLMVALQALGQGWVISHLSSGNALLGQYYGHFILLTVFITLWTVAELYALQMYYLAVPKGIRELGLRLLLLACYLAYAWGYVEQGGMLWSFTASYFVCMLLLFAYLGRLGKLRLTPERSFITPKLKRDFVRYTLLAMLTTTLTMLGGRMDVLVLAFTEGEGLRSAAVFTIGFFIVSIMEIPTRAIIGMATARIAQAMHEERLVKVRLIYEQTARYQLLTALVIYILLVANMDDLLQLMPGGEDYTGAKMVVYILGLSKLVEVTLTPCHAVLNSSRHYPWAIGYSIWLCLIALVSNLVLVPRWGIQGASVATLLTTLGGYAFLQGLIILRLGHITPWSPRLPRVILLGVALGVGVYCLPEWGNPYIAIVLNSTLIALGALLGVYALDLTPELRRFLTKRKAHG